MNYIYYEKSKNPIKRFDTSCCALCQLSLNNAHTIEEISSVIESIKKESDLKWNTNDRSGGERAIFVIATIPMEMSLVNNLEFLGFKYLATFKRRNGYPEGLNQMWILSW